MAVSIVAVYYTAMLLIWTAPAVLQAKVAAEEGVQHSLLEEGTTQLLEDVDGVELEELRSNCDELKALLQRERHDHAVEVGQLLARLRDQELLTRSAQKGATPRATEARKKVCFMKLARNSHPGGLERQPAESPASKLPREVKSPSHPGLANRQGLRTINPSRHPQSLLQRLAVAARAASRRMMP